jgi:H+-translocating NAD(P) transhydrogenase subunit beta
MTNELRYSIIGGAYFISAFMFILGLKQMTAPPTARRGNMLGALAMLIAVGVTLLDPSVGRFGWIFLGILIGGVAGTYWARKVEMTEMPQMVALFNGMGGGTAALVSIAEFMKAGHMTKGIILSAALGTAMGALSFSGSLAAFGKLQGLLPDRPLKYSGQMILNALLLSAMIVLATLMILGASGTPAMLGVALATLLLGVLAVLPIGGADMPVVIALLNSCTGVASALTGFVLNNQILIVAGALVGASGTLLTFLMARAMNRPVSNVLFGAFGTVSAAGGAAAKTAGRVRETTAEDTAIAMIYSRQVIVVPGYGLAVAQAQQLVRELADELGSRGVTVKFAIHPVAGRMPGHMNVVLADANIPYQQLVEMDDINGEFGSTDVVLVIGANDVVNPAAKNDPTSPIYGMPILDAEKARNVVVMKRSMNPGFAGIDNELFYRPNTAMLFGDAKASLTKLVHAVKSA